MNKKKRRLGLGIGMIVLAVLILLGLLARPWVSPRPPAQLTHEQSELMFAGLGMTPIPPGIERICVLLQFDYPTSGITNIRVDLPVQGMATLLKGDLFAGSEETNIEWAAFRDVHYIRGWGSTSWWNPGLAINEGDELTLLAIKTGWALFAQKEDRVTAYIVAGHPLPGLHEEYQVFRSFMEGYYERRKFTQPVRGSAYTRCWTMPEPRPQ